MENSKHILSARTSFLAYVRLMQPLLHLSNHHHRVIQQYQALANGFCLSSQAHVPPQSGTTTLALLFMAFMAGHARPHSSSESYRLAYVCAQHPDQHAKKVRNYISSELHQEVFPREIDCGMDTSVTIISGPVILKFFKYDGNTTGWSFDGIVFDAGYDKPEALVITKAFAALWLTRLSPRTFIHLQGCRWSKDDWYALALADPRDWSVIVAPALVEDRAYWPTVWPSLYLAKLRGELSPETWAAQYMQHPIA